MDAPVVYAPIQCWAAVLVAVWFGGGLGAPREVALTVGVKMKFLRAWGSAPDGRSAAAVAAPLLLVWMLPSTTL